jgi:membrane associated rhomboid family serine protease
MVRSSTEEASLRDWAVVLQAAGVPCRIARGGYGWALIVARGDEAAAHAALAAYDAEASVDEDVVEYGPTFAGLVLVVGLVAGCLATGFGTSPGRLFTAGEGSAARILSGEPWRAVTALMLHADVTHLLGNVVAMGILATAVCRLLGPGLGAGLIVLAGTVGNLLNAILRGAPHVAIGASTAVFGAVGILAGLAIVRARSSRRRPWVPFAAGLALLALLGTGEHTDLAAHFFGFQTGLGLGLAAAVVLDQPPGPRVQRWLGIATGVVIVTSWLLAAATMSRR